MGVIVDRAAGSHLSRLARASLRRQSGSPWRFALRPGVVNTAAAVIATAQEPQPKRRRARTIAPMAVRHCSPRTARPEKRRRARSPSRRPAADHPPATGVNRDASLFFCATENGPSGRHASGGRDGSADSACRPRGASGDAPVRRSRCRSRSARGHSSCTRPPGSDTARTGTDGQPLAQPARRRRLGVDGRHPWQDTRPAFVPSTVWGTASRQNCQVMVGAVLAPQFWQASDTLPRRTALLHGAPAKNRIGADRGATGSRRPATPAAGAGSLKQASRAPQRLGTTAKLATGCAPPPTDGRASAHWHDAPLGMMSVGQLP